MNIDVEVSFKVKVTNGPRAAVEKRRVIALVLERIAAHPAIALILRELMRQS